MTTWIEIKKSGRGDEGGPASETGMVDGTMVDDRSET
jgi:hypothetical protein